MKEYKTNLMKTTWNYRRILLMALLAAFDLLMSYTVSQSSILPIWLDRTGVLMAACIGGPAYGVILILVETVIQLLTGGGLVMLIKGIAAVAAAAAFGTYVRLGFFSNIKGVLIGILTICFVGTCIRMPEYFALFGSFTSDNIVGKAILETLTEMKLPHPIVSMITFFIIDLIDKGLILFTIYGIIKHKPKTISKLFDISDPLPQCVIVKDTAEEEFLSEKEQLAAKAQKKLDERKNAESLKRDELPVSDQDK